MLIQESVSEKFLKILNDKFSHILVGQNMSKTDMSCIVTEKQKEVLTECLEEADKFKGKVCSFFFIIIKFYIVCLNFFKCYFHVFFSVFIYLFFYFQRISMSDIDSKSWNYAYMMPTLISNLPTNFKLVHEEVCFSFCLFMFTALFKS